MAVVLSGLRGRLSVGYQQAADLGKWSLAMPKPLTYLLDAEITAADSYWISQRPIDITVELGGKAMTWRSVNPEVTDLHVSASLAGPPDVARI